MIKIDNVDFRYKNEETILKNINLEIQEGEFICIIGKNGSGKSTLAKLIAGIEKPKQGNIFIDELNTKKKQDFFEIRKKIGIVFQNPENQILFNNVYDDIAFAIKNLNLNDEKVRIEDSLKKVKMSDYINKDTYELSLGQKQRITIAGMLAINPQYLIFDEPTTMLDSEGKEDIYEIIKELKKQGITVIYITNVIDEILMADKIILLEKGEIKKEFNKTDILGNISLLREHGIKIPKIAQGLETCKENNININLQNWTFEELIEKMIEVLKSEEHN